MYIVVIHVSVLSRGAHVFWGSGFRGGPDGRGGILSVGYFENLVSTSYLPHLKVRL